MAKEEPRSSKKRTWRWIVQTIAMSFVLTVLFSLLCETTFENVSLGVALIVLFVLISLGVVFDIIGIAVASAQMAPFIAMAAKKVRGARQCIWMLKNAEKVSNFCNDLIGDICSIVSGAAGAVIVGMITHQAIDGQISWTGIVASSLIAALTIGGKAMGKNVAMNRSKDIIFTVGRMMSVFSRGK